MVRQILLFFLLLICVITSCVDTQLPVVKKAVSEVKAQYAPDKRVAIFSVDTEKQGNAFLLKGETNLPEAKAALQAKLNEENLPFIDSIRTLPAIELGGKNYGVVRLSVCNIRSKPKHSSELSTQATLGTPLRVYKEQKGWYYIQTPDNYLGWLDADGFTLMDKSEYNKWMVVKKTIITAEFTQVYSAPDVSSSIVSDVLPGNILEAKGKDGDLFEKVGFPDGREGYVPVRFRQYLQDWLSYIQADTSGIFRSADRLMGMPYLWGGTSGKGADCSGYTKTVFFENGILLPRDASQQVHVGQEIETDSTLKNLLPGDLLFFGRKATKEQKEKIWHVSIYRGEGKMIHSAGNVKIESLRRDDPDFNEERLNTFVRAKRILGSEGKNGVTLLKDSEFYRQ